MGAQPGYEPLTGREREILAQLCRNLSDREIAAQLFLGLPTVKWYNRHIYAKLGVKNRKQAILAARALSLLDASSQQPAPLQHNLPAALTPFVGRSVELAEVRALIAHPHTRLLTILAPGGMGKTRLALEAAEGLLDQYADGIYYAPLAGVMSAANVVTALAEAFSLQFAADGRAPKQQVLDFLRRKQVLLLIDNFEHLLDAAPLVPEILAAAPRLKILVTSREKLSVTGEVVYALSGIHYPNHEADDLLRYGAVQLFIECALRANPRFDAGNGADIAHICRLVQGMPLAIELAAASAGMLPTDEIAREIERSADFLKSMMRDVPDRLRSIRAVFEAAWARLDDEARRVFRWLSVFRGGCTREAARAITGASPLTLVSLVDKALLWCDTRSDRYDVHELLRQYAEGELAKAGETDAARQAHQDYYAALADEWAHAMQRGKQLESFAILGADIDNIRQSLARAISRGLPEEIGCFTELIWYYDIRGWWNEYITAMRAAANALEPHDSVALAGCLMYPALYDSARLFLDNATARKDAQRALDMVRRLGAREVLPMALMAYADSIEGPDTIERFDQSILEAFAIAEEFNDPPIMGALWLHSEGKPRSQQNWPEARTRQLEAHRCYEQSGNYWGMCHTLNAIGQVAFRQGDFEEVKRCATEILTLAKAIDFDVAYTWGLDGLTIVAQEERDWQSVLRLNAEFLHILRRIGAPDHQLSYRVLLDAEAAVMLNEPEAARRRLLESVSLLDDRAREVQFGLWRLIAASYLVMRDAHSTAAAFLGGLGQHGRHGMYGRPFNQQHYDILVSHCRAALTPGEFAAAVERGKTLTPDAAITALMPFL